ncbi:DNA cytosine methyltransferase [bacterium]|nr:DNA cytosine methyltransferase [bacterium]
MLKKLTYFSLFTGAGGLDIGFKEAGYKSLGSSDLMDESEEMFKMNWPNEPFIKKDIRELTDKEILKITKGKKPDVIIGGPPCQGFSVMGDKNSSDPRNTLFQSYVRLVEGLRPKCFVFENVKGFKTMFGGRYIVEAANSFASLGYDVYVKILNAADYGVPQNRQRVILVGTRIGNKYTYPKPTCRSIGCLKEKANVEEAIMDLVDKGGEVANHLTLDHGDIVVRRYKLIPEGGKLPPPEELPLDIRRKNFGNTYIRLHRKKKSSTMVPGNNAFPVHPTLNRSLTPREAARIQTFPDNIKFSGSRKMQCILVGNAVPPLLGAHIAKSIKDHINSKNKKEIGKDIFVGKNSMVNLNKLKKKIKGNKKPLTFVDLFSGAGGITVGFMAAGLKPLLCCDNNKYVAETHRKNFPDIPYIEDDLSTQKAKKLTKELLDGEKVDIVVGGPPCQGFSIFGNRRFVNTKDHDSKKDPRNELVYTFIDYVKLLNPTWFMMENVPGFASLDNGSFLKIIIKDLEKMGYTSYDYKIINTADYGVPQTRKRFILIGNRKNLTIPWPKPKYFKDPEDWQKKYRTVGEVITDLAAKGSYSKNHNHEPMNHSDFIKERFSYIEEGKKMDLDKLPNHLKIGKNTKKPIKNFSHIYKRLDRNKPSSTMVPGHSAFPIHPWLNRQLTVREAARIQTLPDDLEIVGSSMEQCRQVGNAFPAMAAEHFGNFLSKATLNNWSNDSISNLAKYSLIDVKE